MHDRIVTHTKSQDYGFLVYPERVSDTIIEINQEDVYIIISATRFIDRLMYNLSYKLNINEIDVLEIIPKIQKKIKLMTLFDDDDFKVYRA
jgi:hypothetical protein